MTLMVMVVDQKSPSKGNDLLNFGLALPRYYSLQGRLLAVVTTLSLCVFYLRFAQFEINSYIVPQSLTDTKS